MKTSRSLRHPSLWQLCRYACLLLVICTLGCHKPSYYRQQADEDANCMVDLKSAAAGVAPGSYRINIDPRSRMYDPNDPDCEPMPPDDPTSHRYMECIDCKKGEKCWKCLPQTPFVENPGWMEHLPYDEQGQVVLDLHGAVELALLESPRYQSQLEELYLSALDVTFERFRFDTQFFGGSSLFYTADGRERSGTGSSSSLFEVNPLNPSNRLRAQKLTATGGQLVVGLANSLVWQFAGSDNYSSNTILDFSIFQPLLRASGRGRVLERLTITERSLLANVRQMERFRRNFFVSIYSGADPGQGASRRGGFFGGSGLDGFSGVGGGGFGRLGGGGGGGGSTGGAGAQGAGGYLGLLQSAQVLRNQRANVLALRDSVLQLEASNEAGRIDRFQLDLAKQALFNSQSQLLSSENGFQTSLESFQITLGLPPELDVKVSDPMLDRMNLLDPELEGLQRQVANILSELRLLREIKNNADEAEQNATEPADKTELLFAPNQGPLLKQEPNAQEIQTLLANYLLEAEDIKATAQQRLTTVQADFERLETKLPERSKYLERLAQRPEVRDTNIDPALFSPARLLKRVEKRLRELQSLEGHLTNSFEQLDQITTDSPQALGQLITTLSNLSGQLLELSLAQASARLDTINFTPVDLTSEQALAIASHHRRDWMNARASLVDSWRLIYFNANDLQSNLDIVFSGDLGNVGDNPFDLHSSRGRLRVGLEFDAPLNRLSERNIYRQSLIEYQQARRQYYQFRDRIFQGLRNTLRQIRLNEVNFELRRAAVHVAISQVDLTQLRLSEPPKPGETSELSNSTARDLVQALSDLLNVQNDFLSVWVNYEVQRLNLEVNLGVMELAPNGLRIENNIPLETYLANLPINSTDLGPIVTEKLLSEPVELLPQPVEEQEGTAEDPKKEAGEERIERG